LNFKATLAHIHGLNFKVCTYGLWAMGYGLHSSIVFFKVCGDK